MPSIEPLHSFRVVFAWLGIASLVLLALCGYQQYLIDQLREQVAWLKATQDSCQASQDPLVMPQSDLMQQRGLEWKGMRH